MSKLQLFSRPLVAFDPADKNHRRWFFQFQNRRSWGSCPVRFIIPDDHGDLVSLCRERLIEYYVKKEFGKNTI